MSCTIQSFSDAQRALTDWLLFLQKHGYWVCFDFGLVVWQFPWQQGLVSCCGQNPWCPKSLVPTRLCIIDLPTGFIASHASEAWLLRSQLCTAPATAACNIALLCSSSHHDRTSSKACRPRSQLGTLHRNLHHELGRFAYVCQIAFIASFMLFVCGQWWLSMVIDKLQCF